MIYLDTCVLLALSALALKVRTGDFTTDEADRVIEGFESSLAPVLLWLDLEADDFRNANASACGAAAPASEQPMPCIWRSLPVGAPRSAAWMPPSCTLPSSWALVPC